MNSAPLIEHLIRKELNLSEEACYTEIIVAIKTILSENKKFRSRAIATDERADKLEVEIQEMANIINKLNELLEEAL